MAYIDFYHYSSEDAIDAIINDGIINESPDGGSDAHFGSGKGVNLNRLAQILLQIFLLHYFVNDQRRQYY